MCLPPRRNEEDTGRMSLVYIRTQFVNNMESNVDIHKTLFEALSYDHHFNSISNHLFYNTRPISNFHSITLLLASLLLC